MSWKAALAFAGWLLATAQAAYAIETPTPAELVAPEIGGVVAAGTKVQLLREGLRNTEGPVATPDGGLLFTEQDVSQITRIDRQGNFSTYVEDTHRTIGLAYDAKGRLVGAAQAPTEATGMVIVLAPTRAVLADSYAGQPLSRPNDLIGDRKGGVYFTDPFPVNFQPGQRPVPPGRKPAVFYIGPDGRITMVAELQRPNGINLSLDEETLYVANGESIAAFDVEPDGRLRNQRTFATLVGLNRNPDGTLVAALSADGITLDSVGRVYTATGVGVQVFSPRGRHLGTIPVPRPAQNLAFSGPDKTLYVVARGSIYTIAMQAQGAKHRGR